MILVRFVPFFYQLLLHEPFSYSVHRVGCLGFPNTIKRWEEFPAIRDDRKFCWGIFYLGES